MTHFHLMYWQLCTNTRVNYVSATHGGVNESLKTRRKTTAENKQRMETHAEGIANKHLRLSLRRDGCLGFLGFEAEACEQ